MHHPRDLSLHSVPLGTLEHVQSDRLRPYTSAFERLIDAFGERVASFISHEPTL